MPTFGFFIYMYIYALCLWSIYIRGCWDFAQLVTSMHLLCCGVNYCYVALKSDRTLCVLRVTLYVLGEVHVIAGASCAFMLVKCLFVSIWLLSINSMSFTTCNWFGIGYRYVANMYSHTFWFVLLWGRLPPSMSVIYEISLRWMIIFPCWNGYVWKFPNCFFAYSELMGQSWLSSYGS